ncbi:TRAP transporter large permease [Hoyosella sp. YIM 151337]|uniref:TRAP transporter large permease n=1 Tax=Hoyosella sp. YIM 151337 TaxID=2992742 RepID=UPI00223684CD|nr:TRAP transporter large permease [Hoyosella sp. YIM 151337]MCW4355683.1 TRAP transporter large permease [Hoyosella sp. YIM 151337]
MTQETRVLTTRHEWLIRAAIITATGVCVILILGPSTRETVGGAAVTLMLLLVFLKVPIGIALTAPGVLGLYGLYGPAAATSLLGRLPYDTVASWELSVIPMFIFMGVLLWRAGVTQRVYSAARGLIGWMPGGLAVVTNGAGAGLAAVSGTTVGTVHALARIGVPEMLRAGYDRRLAVGSTIVAGLPGQVIPPSIFLVIYAGLAQVPVGQQLIAGVVPGLLMAAFFALTVIAICTARPQLAGVRTGSSRDRFRARELRTAATLWPLPTLIVLVLGGMYTGAVTVTEAGAVGALGATLLALWYQRKDQPWQKVATATTDTLKSVGTIFFLFIGAMALARVLSVSGIGPGFARWVGDMGFTRIEFLLIILVTFVIMGMFMDPLSIMLLTVPLLIPVVAELGISPLWFGVFVVILAEVAIITPPVGVLAFIVHDLVKDPDVSLGQRITLGDVFRGIALFLPAIAVLCVVLIAAPGLATFLPSHM